MYLLGYLASQSRVYLIDRDFAVVSYTLLLSVVEYKTLVLRGDMETAADVLENIPHEQHNTLAKFLEAKGMPEMALQVATDHDYQFELAVSLGRMEQAIELATQADSEAKWRQLGELALNSGRLDVAEECFDKAKDLGGLLLLYSSRGDADGMKSLAEEATKQGRQNIAFICRFLLSQVDECIDLLISCGRLPEAAFFTRTYAPSRMTDIVKLWQSDLRKINPKAAESLANPDEFPNLFPHIHEALVAEKALSKERGTLLPALKYGDVEGSNLRDVLAAVAGMSLDDIDTDAEYGRGGDGREERQPLATAELQQEYIAEQEQQEEEFFDDNEDEPVDDKLDDTFDVASHGASLPRPPPPPALPVLNPSGLTPEEEAMLEEDLNDDDLDELDADVDELDADDVDLDDDWGLDDDGLDGEAKDD